METPLELILNGAYNLPLVFDARNIRYFKNQLDHGNCHDNSIVYIKMEGLRSTRQWPQEAGFFFFLIFLLAFSFGLFGEELPIENDTDENQGSTGEIYPALDVEALRNSITNEAPGELINLNLNDSSVSLQISGRWKGSIQTGFGFSLTPLGSTALSNDTPFFTQEGDLTLSLWIKDRWFVEASFLDDSSLNTYRAGYQGKEGEVIQYIGVGNTGLDYPVFPYLDLGGDSPSSFGVYGHFIAGNLALHSLVRYDAAVREEKVFVGDRERSYTFADLSRPQRGISFVLPDERLDATPEVYIQDNRGTLTDLEGRRWRLAEKSEFGASAWLGIVEITLGAYTGGMTEPEGMIAVSYRKEGDSSRWAASMGYYDGSVPGVNFLGKIQEYFDDTMSEIRLWDFPQPGQRSPVAPGGSAADPQKIPATISINGVSALVLYESGTFSPFEKQSRYLAPANTSSQAALVKLTTGETVPGFNLVSYEYNSLDTEIYETDNNSITRGVYELLRDEARDRRSPADCWPLATLYPGLYLPGKAVFTENLGLRFTSYSASSAFYIGSDVIPGSVQVYRNGIQDPNFTYNQSSGTVGLGNTAGFSEVIRISYLKHSSEKRYGSLAAGLGAIWDNKSHFSWKLGLGLRWNLNSDTYSEEGAASPGTVGLGAQAKWDYDSLKTSLSLGLGLEQPDTAGLYRLSGMEGNEIILPLPPGVSFISWPPPYIDTLPPILPFSSFKNNERTALIYRNFQESSFLGGTSLGDINSGSPSVVSGESGPYPAMDKQFSSQVLVAEFDMPYGDAWTGFQTALGLNGKFLEKAGRIEVPFRFMNFSHAPSGNDFIVILQIGSLSGKDEPMPENPNIVMQKILYPPQEPSAQNPASFGSDPRLAIFTLNDLDRIKLQDAQYLRLLVIKSGAMGDVSGRVILAPPIVRGSFWRPIKTKGDEISPSRELTGSLVNVYENIDSSLEIKYSDIIGRLHGENSRQRVLDITWEGSLPGEDFSSGDMGPGADGRIPGVPLSSYRSLSFFVRRPIADDSSRQDELDESTLRFILASGPSSLSRPQEIALDLEIPLSDFTICNIAPGKWTRLEIQDLGSNPKITMDGKNAPNSSVKYRSRADGFISNDSSGSGTVLAGTAASSLGNWRSSYAAVFLVPSSNPVLTAIPKGNMAIDEIFLENAIPSYRMNNGASLDWHHEGTIVAIGNQSVISDLSFSTAVETGTTGNPFENNEDGNFGMNSRSQAGFSLWGIKLTGSYSNSLAAAQSADTYYSWSAGHRVSRSFGLFTIRESFDDVPEDRIMNHRMSFSLDTRVRGTLSGEASQDGNNLRRRWLFGTGGKPSEKFPLDFSLDHSIGINEKDVPVSDDSYNYVNTWLGSFEYLLPDSGLAAEARDQRLSSRIRLSTAPLGTEIYFQGMSSFTKSLNISQSSSLLRLDFPISMSGGDLRMLFRTERESRRNLSLLSLDFREDCSIWQDSFSDSVPLLFSLPIYSLFNTGMEGLMSSFAMADREENYSDLSQFMDRYEFSLQNGSNYGVSSLFIPRRFSLRTSRVMERKLDTPRDTINFGTSLYFSSTNMFGAMGAIPLFNFYMGDDLSHSIETVFSFPKNENFFWTVRADQTLLFFGFRGSELSLNNTLIVDSSRRIGEGNRLSESLAAAWTLPMDNTLLGLIYAAFLRMAGTQSSWLTLANLANTEYELLRKETLDFVFEKTPDIYYGDKIIFSIVAGHESIVSVFGKLNLSTFMRLRVSEDMSTRVFSFLGTIGTSLNLIF